MKGQGALNRPAESGPRLLINGYRVVFLQTTCNAFDREEPTDVAIAPGLMSSHGQLR